MFFCRSEMKKNLSGSLNSKYWKFINCSFCIYYEPKWDSTNVESYIFYIVHLKIFNCIQYSFVGKKNLQWKAIHLWHAFQYLKILCLKYHGVILDAGRIKTGNLLIFLKIFLSQNIFYFLFPRITLSMSVKIFVNRHHLSHRNQNKHT